MRQRNVALVSALLGTGLLLAQEPANAGDGGAGLIERARQIHARVLTLDTHKDIPDELAWEKLPDAAAEREAFLRKFDPTVRGEAQVDFPKMREGHYDCAFFIVYTTQGQLNPPAYKRALAAAERKFEAIERMLRRFPEQIELARTPDDVERIAGSGKLVACIGIENGYPMGEDLALIDRFHARGGRYMSIAHNQHSQLGDSHMPAEPLHGGLTELGRKAVARLNRVGIMIDVSHAAKSTMMQVLELSKAPVLASHSACRSVCDHTRNLDDEQLAALQRNGGVIQCVALGSFVKDSTARDAAVRALRQELGLEPRSDREPIADFDAKMAEFRQRVQAIDAEHPEGSVADFVDHIEHAVKLIGIDHVGIASDFDGGGGVVGWNDASETFNVTLELVKRGYTEEQIARIWSGNTLRLWREVERVGAELRAADGK